MPELELLNRLRPPAPAPPTEAAEAAARAMLAERIAAAERPHRRRLWFTAPALAAAAAAAAVMFVLLGGSHGGPGGSEQAEAATVLRRTADAVAAGGVVPLRPLRPGQYLYTRNLDDYWGGADAPDGEAFLAHIPTTREDWRDRDGTGWRIERRSGAPQFRTDDDRDRWIDAGRPELRPERSEPVLESEDPPPMESFSLPDDPDALYAEIKASQAAQPVGMFRRLGEILRSGYLTAAQRAALYEVAARLPGIELVGSVRDDAGRIGTGVAIDDHSPNSQTREMLIFDPRTGALLAEQTTPLEGNPWYPAGVRTGTTYLRAEVVDHIKQRP